MNSKLIFSKLHIMAFSVLLCLSFNVQAQLYRTVLPDGSVVYTDTPPANAKKTAVVDNAGGTRSQMVESQINLSLLPIEIKNAYNNYPVTLYSTHNCDSCNTGRSLLNSRGIPFVEYTAITPKDLAAIKERFGTDQPSFPILTVGSKVLTGFNSGQWDSYLDVAGFPKTSKLPPSYSNPAAKPLTQPTPEEPKQVQNNSAADTSSSAPSSRNDRKDEGIKRPDIRF